VSEIVLVVGNPRAESRTHRLARTLGSAIATELGIEVSHEVDLATLGARVLDFDDPDAKAHTDEVLGADILILASPTYKATYSGLLKCFLDRLAAGSLTGVAAVPILLGGAPNHALAVDVHFTPLLLELGASVPVRGLFVQESQVDEFEAYAALWARRHASLLTAASALKADLT
jgi:FMN reductase